MSLGVWGLGAPASSPLQQARAALTISHAAGAATGSGCPGWPKCLRRDVSRSTVSCGRRSSKSFGPSAQYDSLQERIGKTLAMMGVFAYPPTGYIPDIA